MKLKNPGPPLETLVKGSADQIPAEFRAKSGLQIVSQQSPLDVEPNEPGFIDLLLESRVEQTRTDERRKVNTYLLNDLITELLDETFIQQTGQVGTRTRRLVPEGTELVVDARTESADQHNLGNGLLDQVMVQAPELFHRYSYARERPVVTPQDFRATLQEQTYAHTEDGQAADPTLTGGQISIQDEDLDVWHHRLVEHTLDLLSLPVTIDNYDTNQYKQAVLKRRILEDDSTTPVAPTALMDTRFTKLGDGTALQEEDIVGAVFDTKRFVKERPVVTPEDFRATLQELEETHRATGTAVEPTLGAGDISKSDQQENEFVHQYSTRSIDILSLPQTNTNYKTNEFKQVVTVERTLELDSATPATPDSVTDVLFTKLGDGTALQVVESTEDLFNRVIASVEVPDIMPDIFKASLPVRELDVVSAGTVVGPLTLGPGQLQKSEQQIDEFNMRTRIRGREDLTLPQSKIAARQIGGEPFGGEITQLIAYLNDSEPAVAEGLEVVSSRVSNLGNGTWVRQTEKLDVATEWPDLEGQDYDESLDVLIPFIEKTIEQGTEIGTAKTDIKPLDKWHARKRTIDSTAAALVLDAYLLAYPSKTNVSMPDKLVGLSASIQSQTGDAADSETGSVAGYGNYSINLDLRADATASATIIPEVFADIKQFYGPNINCTHYIFFLPNPVTVSDVITKLNAILSPATVLDWPKFNPETVTILIVGANSALKVNAVSKGSYSQAADLSSQSSTAGGGTGHSRAKGMTLRRMQISPTIHDTISISGTTSDTVNLEAACDSEAVGLGPAESVDITDTISASVTPTTFSATAGDVDWPTTGLYLYRVDARPYKYGYVMFHAIVVDAADFPSS